MFVVVVVVCRLYHEESGREIKLLLSQESITTAEKMCREIQVSLSLSFERYQFWILCVASLLYYAHQHTHTHTPNFLYREMRNVQLTSALVCTLHCRPDSILCTH